MSSTTRWVLWTGAILLALLAAAAALGPLAWTRLMQAQPTQADAEPAPGAEPYADPTTEVRDRVLVLVLGVEGRGKAPDAPPGERKVTGVRSDTLLLASMDPQRRTLSLVSIPRDTLAYLPGRGYDKVTHAYFYGGHELSMQTISRLLDLPINHYVVINWDGFEQVIDAVGGVEIDVEKRMYYVDPYQDLVIDLQPGLQMLDGDHALQYARFRRDSESDWGRMRRQQTVIQALVRKATQPGTALRIPALVSSLFGAVRTDLSLSQSLQFANVGRELARTAPLQTTVLPGDDLMLGGVYYTVADLVKFRTEAYRALLGEAPPADYIERAEAEAARYRAWMDTAIARDREREAARAAEGNPPAGGEALPEGGEPLPDLGWVIPDPDAGVDAGGPGQGDGSQPGEPPADPQPGEQPPADPQPGGGSQGGQAPGEGDPAPGKGGLVPGEGGQAVLEPVPPGITVSVTDASGRGLLAEYVRRLRQRGFEVTRVGIAPAVEAQTLVRDASGAPAVALQLQAVLPFARWEPAAAGGQAVVEVRLGQDAP